MERARAAGRDRGASLIEFAVLAPVMTLVVMGVVDLGRAYQMQIRLENAAREGAAFAQLDPNFVTCGVTGNITDQALREDDRMNGDVRVFAEDVNGDLTVELTGCAGEEAEPGERVLVEVTASFDVLTPIVERAVGNEIELTGAAQIEVQG